MSTQSTSISFNFPNWWTKTESSRRFLHLQLVSRLKKTKTKKANLEKTREMRIRLTRKKTMIEKLTKVVKEKMIQTLHLPTT